ncbi:hypothetical protein IHE45_04G079500 [Dioscorea alata]|uniref:Uncharacterized protein n=1 Tax=Dioscorea alata TaxID=55571 RepID=A0ACB7WE18_DIOAL|nr:hypothetical protein IHE45_04G079500 [Dioscorea alata]
MGQRNIQCSYQMPLLKSGHDQTLFYQDHGIPQPNMVNHTSQSVRPEIAVPGTTADIGLNQFRNHHDMNKNQYGVIQSPHLVTNSDFAGTVPLNPDNRRQVPSFACFSVSRDDGSADEFPSFSMSRLVGVGMDEYGRHNSFADYVRASCKRKNAAMVPGNHFHDGLNSSHGSSSSLSVITEQPLWNEPYQAGFNLLNPSTATPAVYGGINALQATEGSRRNLWSRSNGATIQPDSSAVHHSNYLHQGNCIGQSAPPDNSWMAPFGNNAGGGGCSNWSNPHAVTHLQGMQLDHENVIHAGNYSLWASKVTLFQEPFCPVPYFFILLFTTSCFVCCVSFFCQAAGFVLPLEHGKTILPSLLEFGISKPSILILLNVAFALYL